MCRNIKKLRNPERPPSDEEIHEAALQFVRKVSGYRAPSRLHQEAFNQAVAQVETSILGMFDRFTVEGQRGVDNLNTE
jgi:hypothetical protein